MHIAEKKKYTDEDYMMLEEGTPFQLINYDLIMSPSPNPFHQAIAVKIVVILSTYLEKKGTKDYLGFDLDVKFDEGNVFRPDIVFISEERKNEILKDRIIGPPDMLMEILSPSNAYYDLRYKKDIYEKFGVREYIIVDPFAETAELYSLQDNTYILSQKAQKTEKLNSIVLPGLSFHLSKIFE